MSTNQTPYGFFSSAFFDALARAMAKATGTPWSASAASDAAAPADPLRIRLTVTGGLPGDFRLEFHGEEAAVLARKCLRKEEASEAECSQALLQLVEATTGPFCSVLAPQFGKCSIAVSLATEAAAEGASVVAFSGVAEDGTLVSLRMVIEPALAEALASSREDGFETLEDVPLLPQVNLELVMDVELNVTLRFGQRQLTLREVLDLTSGSVIELDRQVEEPVELLLEGKVIARVEAVVIDGNYGLRVTEVPRPIPSPPR